MIDHFLNNFLFNFRIFSIGFFHLALIINAIVLIVPPHQIDHNLPILNVEIEIDEEVLVLPIKDKHVLLDCVISEHNVSCVSVKAPTVTSTTTEGSPRELLAKELLHHVALVFKHKLHEIDQFYITNSLIYEIYEVIEWF